MQSVNVFITSAALLLAASTALASPTIDLDARSVATGTKCPGGKTGIISPAAGDVVELQKNFNLVFCSSVSNVSNTVELQVGMGDNVLIAPNVRPSKGKIYNESLNVFPGEEADKLFVWETKKDKNGKATFNYYSVPVTTKDTGYYNYGK
ncbi:hypothetical protein V8E36_005787 [Tilletia maclaganii]